MSLVEGTCPQVMFVGGGRCLDQIQHSVGLTRCEVSGRELDSHVVVGRADRIRRAKEG